MFIMNCTITLVTRLGYGVLWMGAILITIDMVGPSVVICVWLAYLG